MMILGGPFENSLMSLGDTSEDAGGILGGPGGILDGFYENTSRIRREYSEDQSRIIRGS